MLKIKTYFDDEDDLLATELFLKPLRMCLIS